MMIQYQKPTANSRKYRGIFKIKSREYTTSTGKLVSKMEHKQVPTEPGVRLGKRSLLACHTRYKCPIETTRNSVKVEFGVKKIEVPRDVRNSKGP